MTSSGRRKKHGLPTEKSTGRGTAPTVAKNMGYRRKKHHRRRKHTLPMQKTWPAVAKNMPSHQDRRKKHPPPLQKTPPTGTVAKNTKTSHRRKKHELPTQKHATRFYCTRPGFEQRPFARISALCRRFMLLIWPSCLRTEITWMERRHVASSTTEVFEAAGLPLAA